MKTPHKHAEVIKAWADGAEIQYKDSVYCLWHTIPDPLWVETVEYRVKPETIKYRVALMRDIGGYYTNTYNSGIPEEIIYSSYTHFVKWLTDWVEVEV
jgi:hypothetical protein